MGELIGDFIVKLIRLEDAKPDMILARDIVTVSGQMLMPKETPVAAVNPDYIRSKGIDYIYVKDFSVSSAPVIPPQPFTQMTLPVTERKDFQEFSTVYENVTGITKQYITAICKGTSVTAMDMTRSIDHIMSNLQRKSDIVSFISCIKEKDEAMYTHSNNVSLLCNLFGRWLGLNEVDLLNLTTAGMLHDIGKTQLPVYLLNRNTELTQTQNFEYFSHPMLGYELVQELDIPESIKLAVLMHHERMDGTGYPVGLKDTRISDMAKIIYICNTYDNLTTGRNNKPGQSPFDVLRTFETSGYTEMDPKYLLIFIRNIAFALVGNWVLLSNNEEAKVFFINHNSLSRPIVHTATGNVIDLSMEKGISITKLL